MLSVLVSSCGDCRVDSLSFRLWYIQPIAVSRLDAISQSPVAIPYTIDELGMHVNMSDIAPYPIEVSWLNVSLSTTVYGLSLIT